MANEEASSIKIYCDIATKLNFACHQNAFALLRDLRIENGNSQIKHETLLVTLTANPLFLKPKSWRLDRLSAGAILPIKDRDIELNGNFLLNLSDSMRGTVTITVEQGEQILAQETKSIELLAYNEWGGTDYMPELLAAFAMPNESAIDRVLHDASLILRASGKPDGIDGYQSGSRQRVWEITSAIYAAISNLGITYAVPPASFERNGQKIRLPGQILENKIATCLDSTLLFAASLEQAGLNPILALPQGHALVGVWLQPEELTTIVIDDAETLRKRIQLKELILIETTCITQHPAVPFSKAISIGEQSIVVDKDDTFNAAIDIRRARAHRITPLGLKSSRTQTEADTNIARITLSLEEAPALPGFDQNTEDEKLPETPAGRLERWQRKLLDLSARNPLLNYKSTKSSLRILCPDPGLLEDKLAEGARISIQSIPQPTSQAQDQALHQQRTGDIITDEYAREALSRNQVLVDLPEQELSLRIVDIYRKAQVALQEGGANTLYLALGFLLWKPNDKDQRRFRAPLVLLPVSIERKSVRSGVKLFAHDDEPRFNTTLLEMLRKDFEIDIRGLDGTLPSDHSGIDLNGIWNHVRQAIKEAPGFEVVEEVVLGHFSFAKYLMWKDLVDRTDALRRNPVVKHLIDTPREPYPSEIAFVDRSVVDREYKPSDLLTPLPADASQMAAIATADRGKDFVIIGPPGTGKSQTISNLIAHLLGKGKTVLFVSEKTAALEVVYRRLKDVDLARFCLQLHSNKASKSDVLEQLRRSWQAQHQSIAENWAKEAETLRGLRDRLNVVVNRLHTPWPNGLTAHYAIGVKVRDHELASNISFNWPSANQHDADRLEQMREAVDRLQTQACSIENLLSEELQLIAHGDWSPQWEGRIVDRAKRLSSAVHGVEQAMLQLLDAINITVPDYSVSRLDALAELANVLLAAWRKPISYALEADGLDYIDALNEAVSRLTDYATAFGQLSCQYDAFTWRNIDGDEIAQNWQHAQSAWWLKRFWLRKRIIKRLKRAGAKGKPNPEKDALLLKQLRVHGEAIDRLDKILSRFKDWQGHSTEADNLKILCKLGEKVRVTTGKLAEDSSTLIEIRSKIRTLLADGNDLLMLEAPVGRMANSFVQAHRQLHEACLEFETLAGQSIRQYFAQHQKALDAIKNTVEHIAANHAELRSWCDWRRRRDQAIALELGPLVSAIESGLIRPSQINEAFEAAYCSWWSSCVIGEDEVLRTFSTPEHAATIEKFRVIDSTFQKLTAAYIAAKLSGQLPDAATIQRSSSWGVLQHELQKKARHKPVRQLIQEIPEVLTALTPCLMMSPLSVAQYLPPDQALFDVIIFDEASQITVWDAVGALARGRQAIVAGDPKQMPPTNFFARADDDPDGEVEVESDLESILDELLGASIPKQTLNLHYRSKRESLIAFSNNRYYGNELITFPAPINPDCGVRLIRPDGFYARGKARHNEGEAKAIVAEIVSRLTHNDVNVRQQSLGVVTFNTEQQSLIENLLDDARAKHPEIEWAFSAEHTLEPVFVKNLETVQGDERDVILFSITYGPDQSGHVTMNFGPLNRTGGERRLNVAMTRARMEMLVFSTLSPDRIDLSRTSAPAVRDLKHFLEYADRGAVVLGAAVHGSLGDFESPFESAVAKALREKGWEVHAQIGVSAYRIDLGIVHPERPGIYLAGIECDGAMYHSSAYARERDKIRQSVLEGLGWTLFRVWSADWWTNREKSLELLHQALLNLLESNQEGAEKSEPA
jgi:very-short-patch-repair endonuclease